MTAIENMQAMDAALKRVAQWSWVTLAAMTGPARDHDTVLMRWFAMALVRQETTYSEALIGELFGRTESGMRAAMRGLRNEVETDPATRDAFVALGGRVEELKVRRGGRPAGGGNDNLGFLLR